MNSIPTLATKTRSVCRSINAPLPTISMTRAMRPVSSANGTWDSMPLTIRSHAASTTSLASSSARTTSSCTKRPSRSSATAIRSTCIYRGRELQRLDGYATDLFTDEAIASCDRTPRKTVVSVPGLQRRPRRRWRSRETQGPHPCRHHRSGPPRLRLAAARAGRRDRPGHGNFHENRARIETR